MDLEVVQSGWIESEGMYQCVAAHMGLSLRGQIGKAAGDDERSCIPS